MPLSSLPVAMLGLPIMPDDEPERATLMGHLFSRLGSIEGKVDATARDVTDLKIATAAQNVVLDTLQSDVSGLKTDRDADRKTYATDRQADRKAIEWADAWRRGLVYFLGALVVAGLGSVGTWVAGIWPGGHK
jgi:hypothetical protein